MGCHVGGLGRSFVLSLSIPSEWPGGTFPEELVGIVVPLPPSVGIHPGNILAFICCCISLMDKPSLLTHSLAARVLFCLSRYHNSSRHSNYRGNKNITPDMPDCAINIKMTTVKLLAIPKIKLTMGYNFTHSLLYNSLQKHTLI